MNKFVVDSMNGKLAKKLRFFGFNTLYYKQIRENEIIKIYEVEQQTGKVSNQNNMHLIGKLFL